jgi:hypothetical protein
MSDIRNIIKEIFVEEAKDRFILKNGNLSADQKRELIDHLKKYSYKENLINEKAGGWSNFNKLTWDDILPIINYESSTLKKKKVKSMGINALEKGKDYVPVAKVDLDSTVYIEELNYRCEYEATNEETFEGIYFPLNWEASKVIAKDLKPCRAKWCTAHTESDNFWDSYIFKKEMLLIYAVYKETKYAILVKDENNWGVFDEYDEPQSHNGNENVNIPLIDVGKLLKDNSGQMKKVREFLDSPENMTLTRLTNKAFETKDFNLFDDVIEKISEISDKDERNKEITNLNHIIITHFSWAYTLGVFEKRLLDYLADNKLNRVLGAVIQSILKSSTMDLSYLTNTIKQFKQGEIVCPDVYTYFSLRDMIKRRNENISLSEQDKDLIKVFLQNVDHKYNSVGLEKVIKAIPICAARNDDYEFLKDIMDILKKIDIPDFLGNIFNIDSYFMSEVLDTTKKTNPVKWLELFSYGDRGLMIRALSGVDQKFSRDLAVSFIFKSKYWKELIDFFTDINSQGYSIAYSLSSFISKEGPTDNSSEQLNYIIDRDGTNDKFWIAYNSSDNKKDELNNLFAAFNTDDMIRIYDTYIKNDYSVGKFDMKQAIGEQVRAGEYIEKCKEVLQYMIDYDIDSFSGRMTKKIKELDIELDWGE